MNNIGDNYGLSIDELMPSTASGEMFDNLVKINRLVRIRYGNDKNKPPNIPKEDYFWNSGTMYCGSIIGWEESDKAFRERVYKNSMLQRQSIL